MVDQPAPKSNHSDEKQNTTSAPPTYLDLYKDEIKPQPKNPDENEQSSKTERNPLKDPPKWTDVAIVVLTAGIVFLAFMQLKEMNSGGKQTDKIIKADKRIATAMESSVRAAQNALNATITQNQLDQRAWVGPISVLGDRFPVPNSKSIAVKEGEKIIVGVQLQNSGKSIAKNFHSCVARSVIPAGQRLDTTCRSAGLPSVSVIQPNQALTIISPETSIVTATNVSQFKVGTIKLYVFGRLTYDDAFGKPHFSKFCMVMDTNLTDFNSCNFYNDAD